MDQVFFPGDRKKKLAFLTWLPIKKLFCFVLRCHQANLEFKKLPPTVMFPYQNTHAETGAPLPLEQSVRYC